MFENMSEDSKKIIKKILFVLSFVPYGLVVLAGIWGAIAGAGFMTATYYGWEGFELEAVFTAYLLCCIVPVIPACAIFHVALILRKYIKLKAFDIKKYWKVCVFVVVAVVAAILIKANSYGIQRFIDIQKAKNMVRHADEIIAYGSTVNEGGIEGIEEVEVNSILIDYDKMKIAVIAYPDYLCYWEGKLRKMDAKTVDEIVKGYYAQSVHTLPSPGASLKTYCVDESDRHRTFAFVLTMKDGAVYMIDSIVDKNGYSVYTDLYQYGINGEKQ